MYQKLNGKIKVWAILIFCLLTTALMSLEAAAQIDVSSQWPAVPTIVSNSNAITVTGKFTPSLGNNRIMLVAVATEYSGAQTPTFTVTYGGQAVTNIAGATNNTQVNKIWVGYLNEAGIVAAGTNKTLSVTASTNTNLVATYVTAAVFAGVDQTTPIAGSGSNASASTAAALAVSAAYNVSGQAGNNAISVYIANWTSGTSTAGGSHTEVRDYAGTNMSIATGYLFTTTGTTTPSTTPSGTLAGAIAGVGLNQIAKPSTVTTCGDCHDNPPNDGTARNVPPGQFMGSHDKHAGTADGLQYAFACGRCHYNAATTKHSTGFKNISGSSVARNSYGGVTNIAITNSPTFNTCTKSTCHSTGRTNIQYATTAAWATSGTTTCLSCHAGRAAGNGVQANSANGFKLSTTHSQHLKYTAAQINCNMCHSKSVSDAQTLKNYTGVLRHADGIRSVSFNDINYGSYTSYKSTESGSSGNTKTCSNVACHGGKTRSAWSNQGALNTTHVCTHCHGQPQSANILPSNTNRNNFAPGYLNTGTSTDQNTASTDLRVGSHFVHLSSVYMKKLKCNECHRVPSTPFDGTHMTGPRYSSQSITFAQASTAIKNGLTGFTSYTSGTGVKAATCSTVYCHGAKTILLDTAGTNRKPSWNQDLTTGTPGATECARCHGNPPNSSSGNHSGATATTSCSGCHPNVVNASGAIINKSLHINGANDYSMACNNCHDYDTRTGGTVWGNTNYGGTVGLEGRGAHAKHIEYLKTKSGFALNAATDTFGGSAYNAICGVCHTVTIGDHTPANTAGSRIINFGGSTARQYGSSAPLYNGVYNTSSGTNVKSCSNLDCHYRTSPIWSTW